MIEDGDSVNKQRDKAYRNLKSMKMTDDDRLREKLDDIGFLLDEIREQADRQNNPESENVVKVCRQVDNLLDEIWPPD